MQTDYLILSNGLARQKVPRSSFTTLLAILRGDNNGRWTITAWTEMSVWWLGLSHQLTQLVERCSDCAKKHRPSKEPLIKTSLPEYPWQVIAAGLFYLKGTEYLEVVDYFSHFPEVIQLRSTTARVSLIP